MEKICNCKIPKNLQENRMADSIASYLAALPPEECAPDAEYERRLLICSRCEALIGGLTCGHCGCFVLARAKKTAAGLPDAGKR